MKVLPIIKNRKIKIGIVNGDLQNSEFKNLIEGCNAGVAIESNFLSEIDQNNIIDILSINASNILPVSIPFSCMEFHVPTTTKSQLFCIFMD